MDRDTALSRAVLAAPPRLRFATAGCPAWWSAVTQSMPAMTPALEPEPAQSSTRDGHQRDAFGHTVGRAADRARHVGAVPVAVVGTAAVDGVVAGHRPAAEVRVVQPDAGVDDVGLHSGAGCGVAVGVAERQRPLVDAVQAP